MSEALPPGSGGSIGPSRRLHPLSPVLGLVRLIPTMVIYVVVLGWTSLAAAPLFAFGAAVFAGGAYLRWSRFTYGVEGPNLVVQSGILNRTRRVVPRDRIQQIDLQRKLVHQVTGLAVVRIDTAGVGDAAEVVLDAVSEAEARRIEAELRGVDVGGAAAAGEPRAWNDAAPSAEREVMRIGPARLAVAGITGGKLLAIFAVVGTAVGLLDDAGRSDEVFDSVTGESRPGVVALVLAVVVGVPLWLALGAGASILADGGYRMVRRGDLLRIHRGLLDQREASVAAHRVQVVWVRENPLRRLLGLASVSIRSAGGSGDGDDQRVSVPIVRRSELQPLLREIVPAIGDPAPLRSAPPAARRRVWTRRIGLTLLLGGVALAVAVVVGADRSGFELVSAVVVVALVVAGASAELHYRALGWSSTPTVVVARHGGFHRTTALVPTAKAQGTRLISTPFQRRVGLASLAIDVAGRGPTPTVIDVEDDRLEVLRHEALATASARRDEVAVRRAARASMETATAPDPGP